MLEGDEDSSGTVSSYPGTGPVRYARMQFLTWLSLV